MSIYQLLLLGASALASASPVQQRASQPMSNNSLGFYWPDATSPQKFDIHVDQELLDWVEERARTYRAPKGLWQGWDYEGVSGEIMADLAKYWAESYDFRSVEAEINTLDHYATTVPGNGNYTADIPLHFIHHPSQNESAIPLLLLHGWTSTHLEWVDVIEPLNDRFHIIAPDLPGQGFSPAPTQPGMGPREMGVAFDDLMKQLGYDRYGLATTDLGWFVGHWMTNDVPDSLIAHFTDFMLLEATADDLERFENGETTEEENVFIEASLAFEEKHFVYSIQQAQKPLKLAHATTDSPVGFAAWAWDLMRAGGDGRHEYTFEEVITKTFTMAVQGPYAGFRAYTTIFSPENIVLPRTEVPTGATQWGNADSPFPELANFPVAPRDWAERIANVVYFKQYSYGGHYPAEDATEEYVSEVREFYASL